MGITSAAHPFLAGELGGDMKSKTLALAAILYLPLTHAQEALPPVVVTASRLSETVDEALAPVVVLTREDIERSQAVDVAELLRFEAGIDIGRNGGPGQATSVFLRGTNSNHTLVMIDGVRINPGTAGGAPLQFLNPELIERIEIVKGPRSTLYGSDAIGGVINIITRTKVKGRKGHLHGEVGRYHTFQVDAAMDAGGKRGYGGLRVLRFDTQGFPTRTASDIDRGYDNVSFRGHAGTHWGPVDVELSHFQAQGTVEYLDFFLNPLDQDFYDQVSLLTLSFGQGPWQSALKVSHVEDEVDQNQSSDFFRTRRQTLDWQNDIELGDHLLSGGIYAHFEDVASRIFGSGFDEDNGVQAIFLQDNVQSGRHQGLVAWRLTHDESFGFHPTWNFAYGLDITPKTRLIASYGTAFHAPDATSRFGFGGNPDLDPERSRNIELDLRHTFANGRAGINLFHNRITDLIQFTVTEAFPQGHTENIGRARIKGIEGYFEGNRGPLAFRISAILQDPRDLDTGELLPRRAKRSLAGSILYRKGRYALGLDALIQSRRKDSAFSEAFNGGYALFNLTGEMRFGRLRLQGRVENLLDRDYHLAAGFNTPGRSLFLGLRYAL
ncbi:MAG: TonB-dependent receptor [Gammaproteobacteria bacterium]|nr:MAG: TonB-dependent receptor [Gammaproteobacteria bacterium]